MRWVGHVARLGERTNAYRVLVGTPKEKRLRGRSKLRWKDNIKKDLQERELGSMDWIDLTQDRESWWAVLKAVMDIQVP
jgi:hypothetical protein